MSTCIPDRVRRQNVFFKNINDMASVLKTSANLQLVIYSGQYRRMFRILFALKKLVKLI